MYSEKLKKLIQDKTPLKFRIKDEQQSKELQDFLFCCKRRWDNWIVGVYCNLDSLFLSIDDEFIYWIEDSSAFDNNENQEFDLKNDCLVENKTDKYQTMRQTNLANELPDKYLKFIFTLAKDHYWDSFQDEKDIILHHIESILKQAYLPPDLKANLENDRLISTTISINPTEPTEIIKFAKLQINQLYGLLETLEHKIKEELK